MNVLHISYIHTHTLGVGEGNEIYNEGRKLYFGIWSGHWSSQGHGPGRLCNGEEEDQEGQEKGGSWNELNYMHKDIDRYKDTHTHTLKRYAHTHKVGKIYLYWVINYYII